jgi:hypothetical protein
MSAMINNEGMPALMDDLIRDLTDRQLWLVRTTTQNIARRASEP